MSYILSGDSGTVVFDRTGTITNESPTMSSQVTSNPIEGGGKITDHAVLDPIKFSITGIVSTAAGYATLEAMWRNRDLLTYRGAEAFNNLLIINLKRTRTPDNAAGFGFTVSFQQITITSAAFVDIQAPAMSQQDASAPVAASAAKSAKSTTQNGLVTTGSDYAAYYTIQWNQAPTTPPGITVPDSVKSGKDAAISWAASTDPESDDITYQLDRWSNNTNAWTTIYTGSNTSFTDTGITTAMDSVQWRVRAKDSKDAYSAYTTSQVKTVTHNADPTVSGADANLGAVTSPPSRAYTVGDVDDGDTLTIVEALDGSEVRTIEDAERGKTYTFGLTAAQFAALAAGEHSMTITVTDSAGNSATRVVTFSRSITMISVQRDAIETDAMAEKILISVRFLGAENNLTVEACNNAKDATPTWEAVTPGRKHLFTNKTKTATKWAVGVRVKLTKTNTSDTIALYGVSGSYL